MHAHRPIYPYVCLHHRQSPSTFLMHHASCIISYSSLATILSFIAPQAVIGVSKYLATTSDSPRARILTIVTCQCSHAARAIRTSISSLSLSLWQIFFFSFLPSIHPIHPIHPPTSTHTNEPERLRLRLRHHVDRRSFSPPFLRCFGCIWCETARCFRV